MNLKEGFTFIDNIEELSAMPAIALDVMGMLNDPNSRVKNIVEKVRLDQAMVSYIIKHCNSPFYGIRSEVTSIERGINLLGYTNLKSILMSYFMRNLYHLSGKNEIKDFLWKHSIAVAVFAKNLGEKLKLNSDEAYVAGLLHDIGKIVLYLDDKDAYAKVVEAVQNEDEDFLEAEKRLLEFTHVDTGYFLLEKWKFSQILKDVALYHHDLKLFVGSDQLIGVVSFANHLAHVFIEKRFKNLDEYLERFNMKENELDMVVEISTAQIEDFYTLL
ncbi:MAG: HDOD domain-containing protein [bacterium]|nr:HDOD domain-containing protein [bacterium]